MSRVQCICGASVLPENAANHMIRRSNGPHLEIERLRDLLLGYSLDLQYVGPGDIEEGDEWEYLAARLGRSPESDR
jgi:hypothetical protein